MSVRFPTDLDAKSTGLKNEDKLMLGDSDNTDIAKYILLSVLRAFLAFVDTEDTSSTDEEIVVENGITGKMYKKSGKFFSTDGTFADNSDDNIPTEKAVKTYVDTAVPYIAYGEIYGHDNATSEAIANGVNYTKVVTGFTANGVSENTTPNESLGQITVANKGKYRISYSLSYTCDINNVEFFGAVFINDVEQNNIHSATKIGTGADVRTSGSGGIIELTQDNMVVDFRLRHNYASPVNVTIKYLNLNVHYLGNDVNV